MYILPSFYTAATLATEEGIFDMKMHDLGPKIAYLHERPGEAPPPPLVSQRGLRPGPGGPQTPPPPNLAPFNLKL